METSTLAATAVVLGSMVAATATIATTWITQRTLNRRELIRDEIRKRETLYGEFIAECGKLLMDSFSHSLEKPETLLSAYALLNRVRLSASSAVLGQAERVLGRITDQYFATNLTLEQMRDVARSSEPDPLKAFGEACRTELHAMRKKV